MAEEKDPVPNVIFFLLISISRLKRDSPESELVDLRGASCRDDPYGVHGHRQRVHLH